MLNFRNFIVHRYENVDPEIVFSILNNYFDEFTQVVEEIENYG